MERVTLIVKFLVDYSSTDAGNLANLYFGTLLYPVRKWQDAIKSVEKSI